MGKSTYKRANDEPPKKAEDIQEISLLYEQLQNREIECLELRHQCALLRSENRAMTQQLEAIYGIVFRQK